ncbi:YheC/YheD family protein [Sporosarcina sp. ACRSM]|uniref:YheC/YheD family protein n=1 Tax=Sporosarcina sp. ACRSM TaxID=2918216 RepID=UPI001EF61EB3|nr:YheC/YheD family protein [Sporosarcina sp. ACRSM]MCG7337046.1 YheC/YheD family protein [Sporosarcina sp. ACRSM]
MKRALGKWEQSVLFQQHPVLAKHIPETILYSEKNLIDFSNRYPSVFVKHDMTGQGRAIFKIHKSNDRKYNINGFTIQGTPIQKSVSKVSEIRLLLHPFIKLGRESGPYILQEDIQSYTRNGQPFSIRVHIQKLNNKWMISGMYGTTATSLATESGIVNPHRGATVMTISEIFSQTKFKNNEEDTVKKIEEVAITAAKAIDSVLPCREYGIDFGINQEGTPVLFEVNTTPGIMGFAQIENKKIWKRIVEIRKMQSESDESTL